MLNLLLSLLGTYALICFGAWVLHRYFLYMPDQHALCAARSWVSPTSRRSLSRAKTVSSSSPGTQPAERGKPTLLYFTGNSGSAANRARKIEAIAACGYGVFMLNYRRYGGSGGWPTERNNIADAVSAYHYLRTSLAWRHAISWPMASCSAPASRRGLRLLRRSRRSCSKRRSPRWSMSAAQVWWFLPLRLDHDDQYRTIDHIGSVKVPLLIVHGARDSMIPVTQARHLYAAANEPKKLAILPRGDHNDLFDCGAWAKVEAFLEPASRCVPRSCARSMSGQVALASVAGFTPNTHSSCPATAGMTLSAIAKRDGRASRGHDNRNFGEMLRLQAGGAPARGASGLGAE